MGIGGFAEGEQVNDLGVRQFLGASGQGPDELQGLGAAGADEDSLAGHQVGDSLVGRGHHVGVGVLPVRIEGAHGFLFPAAIVMRASAT